MTRTNKAKRSQPTPPPLPAEPRHFMLRAPGRPSITLTAATPEQLARLITHQDVGACTARGFARQLWDAKVGALSDDMYGTYLERVATEGRIQ